MSRYKSSEYLHKSTYYPSMTLHFSKCIPEVTREQLDALYRKKNVAPRKTISEINVYLKPLAIQGGAGYTAIITGVIIAFLAAK